MQPEFLTSLLQRCKEKGIHIALDTSGYAQKEIFEKFIEFVDLFLYDLKIIDNAKHMYYTGVSSDLILSNLELLSKKDKHVIIRIPIIPGITDTEENLSQLSDFIKSLRNIHKVSLLPYNKMGEEKYRRLNRVYKTENIKSPSSERMIEIKNYFEKSGLNVEIGG